MTDELSDREASLEDLLAAAARQGDTAEMARTLALGADAAGCDGKGWPITTSAFEENVLKLLINHGASIDARDRNGRTALHWAAFRYLELADLFLRYGADPNARDQNGETPLFFADRGQLEDVASLLIKYGADVNARRFDGQTLFTGSILGNNIEFVSLLLDAGANIELRDEATGETPLITASRLMLTWGPEMSKLFVKRGANLRVLDNNGYAPVHYAAINGDVELLVLMIDAGASMQAKTPEGASPLSLAIDSERPEIVAAILSHGIGRGADS